MRTKKYPITFNKFRDGQSYFERHASTEMLELLLILCTDVEVYREQNKRIGKIIFKLFAGYNSEGESFTVITVDEVPLYLLKKFLPEKEWKSKFRF